MTIKHLLFFIFLLSFLQTHAQTEYRKHLQFVIQKSNIGRTYTFNTNTDSVKTITSELIFLGKTRHDDKVLFIHETYPGSPVRHGFICIYIIDKKGKKCFYSGTSKPMKMTNGVLFFKDRSKTGKELIFEADLNKEIPELLCIGKDNCLDRAIDE